MKYVVLFRGLNVGGKNIVKMNDLKQMLFDLKLKNVKTYIQSGNAVLESDLDETTLKERIHNGFIEKFGFESGVMIRNIEEIQALIEELPFTLDDLAAAEAADPQVEHLYVYFIEEPMEKEQIDLICQGFDETERLSVGKRELYLLCHQSIRNSKLVIRMSKTLKYATARNWKTVNHLFEMLKDL